MQVETYVGYIDPPPFIRFQNKQHLGTQFISNKQITPRNAGINHNQVNNFVVPFIEEEHTKHISRVTSFYPPFFQYLGYIETRKLKYKGDILYKNGPNITLNRDGILICSYNESIEQVQENFFFPFMLYRRGIVGWLYKQQIYQYAPEYQHFEDYHRKELWSKEEIKKCTEMKDTVLDGPDYEKKIEEYRKYSNGKRRYIRKISKTSLSCSGPPGQEYAYFETKSGQQRRLKKKREMQLKQKRWLYGQSYKYINILRRFNCLCCKQLRECEMMTHKEIVAFKKQLKKYNPRPRKKVVDEIQPGVAGEITVTESGQEAYHLITTRYGYTVRTKKPKRKSK